MNFLGVDVGKPYEVGVTWLFWGGVGYLGWQVFKAASPAQAEKLDITSENNVINSVFTDVYQALTGSDQMLGGDLADLTYNIKTWFTAVTSPYSPPVDDQAGNLF